MEKPPPSEKAIEDENNNILRHPVFVLFLAGAFFCGGPLSSFPPPTPDESISTSSGWTGDMPSGASSADSIIARRRVYPNSVYC